jgi:hypothetical protein
MLSSASEKYNSGLGLTHAGVLALDFRFDLFHEFLISPRLLAVWANAIVYCDKNGK